MDTKRYEGKGWTLLLITYPGLREMGVTGCMDTNRNEGSLWLAWDVLTLI